MKMRDTFLGCLCALACETIFGLSYLFTKDATGSATPLALLGWRFAVALAATGALAAAGAVKLRLRGKPLRPLLAVAIASPVLYFVGETYGIARTTASESGAFLACIPIAALVASTAVLRKKPTPRQLAGILVTFGGVLTTVLAVGRSAAFSPSGYALLSLAVVAYALYSVGVEKAAAFTGAELTFGMLAAGALVFGVAAAAEAAAARSLAALAALPFRNPAFLRAVLFQGFACSVVAFFLSNVAIAKIGVNRAASFVGVATVVSIAAGVAVLHEDFSAVQWLGAALVVAGVCLANSSSVPARSARRAPPSAKRATPRCSAKSSPPRFGTRRGRLPGD